MVEATFLFGHLGRVVRWELYRSAELLRVLPLQSLVHDGAESVVENVLVARGINVGEFPGTMFLSCCEEREAQLV